MIWSGRQRSLMNTTDSATSGAMATSSDPGVDGGRLARAIVGGPSGRRPHEGDGAEAGEPDRGDELVPQLPDPRHRDRSRRGEPVEDTAGRVGRRRVLPDPLDEPAREAGHGDQQERQQGEQPDRRARVARSRRQHATTTSTVAVTASGSSRLWVANPAAARDDHRDPPPQAADVEEPQRRRAGTAAA